MRVSTHIVVYILALSREYLILKQKNNEYKHKNKDDLKNEDDLNNKIYCYVEGYAPFMKPKCCDLSIHICTTNIPTHPHDVFSTFLNLQKIIQVLAICVFTHKSLLLSHYKH